MIIPSLINLVVAPMAVGASRSAAKARGVTDFFHRGVAVYASDDHVEMVKGALDMVVSFYGDAWPKYARNLKRIILDPDQHTNLWFGQRSLIVTESDQNRMQSANHMAAWLIADFQRIQFLKERHSLKIIWSKGLLEAANVSGKAMLQKFVDLKTKAD